MPKILIVEDDPGFRTLLETMLRLEGHEVFLAANGENGFSQARSKKPEIILSDIDMPGVSGVDLCRKIRAEDDLKHAYFILITGQGGQEMKLDSLRAGADDFIVKPSSGPEILGRIEIAQKVMAVLVQERAAVARAEAAEGIGVAVLKELDGLDAALTAAEECVAKKNAQALGDALRKAKESAEAARKACGSGGGAAGDSWL